MPSAQRQRRALILLLRPGRWSSRSHQVHPSGQSTNLAKLRQRAKDGISRSRRKAKDADLYCRYRWSLGTLPRGQATFKRSAGRCGERRAVDYAYRADYRASKHLERYVNPTKSPHLAICSKLK